MQKNHFLLLLLVASVSCERMRMLWRDKESSHMDMNCKNWDKETGTCIECYEGCTKWENICVRVVQYCASWDDEGNCISCQPGYGDSQGKSVDGSCPKHQIPTTQNTKTETTTEEHQTQTETQERQTKTQTKQSPSPKQQNSLGSENKQTALALVDIHCQCHTEDRECIDCFNGYYLDFNATCQQLPENCTAANEMGQCTACLKRFAVENGTCVEQECDTVLCTTFAEDQKQCTACSFRSYLDNGCCVQVNGFCSAWVQATGECTGCYQGYVINPNNNKECIPASQ